MTTRTTVKRKDPDDVRAWIVKLGRDINAPESVIRYALNRIDALEAKQAERKRNAS